ncbi:MAG TPA: cysteine desulfurase family protein [Candidatus Eisenbacteria bacterium]|nr:cysteine desulfurase family protein [Candidatus Eisenbacteria bacterium]
MTGPAYLDHAASAPLDPRVAETMAAVSASPGNPSSVHAFGRKLRVETDLARSRVAGLLGVAPGAVTFTSGATEANALALLGAWRAVRKAHPASRLRVVTSPIEHASVRGALAMLAEDGAEIALLPVGNDGTVSAEDAARAITPETALVTVMWVNNVIGAVQPVREIGAAVVAERARRGSGGLPILFHCDAVQAMPSLAVSPAEAMIDLLTISGHKVRGPKGVGVLARPGLAAIVPVIRGGGQEEGLRSGTENVAAIAGMGRAAEILANERAEDAAGMKALAEAFLAALSKHAPAAAVLGDPARRVPHIAFIRVPGMPGDRLALELDAAGYAVSAGSACDGGSRRPSHVLAAVLDGSRAAHGGVRVSFGPSTTQEELLGLAEAIGRAAKKR